MSRETSSSQRNSGLMPRWQNRAPFLHRDGAVWQPNPPLSETLGDVMCRVLAHVEQAAIRARNTDTHGAWAWLAAWGLFGRVVESEWRIASGELPVSDGVQQ
jgi:hypothetical protein